MHVLTASLGLKASARWSFVFARMAPREELLSGSAVRQDGRSASLTAPNGSAQQQRCCLRRSDMHPLTLHRSRASSLTARARRSAIRLRQGAGGCACRPRDFTRCRHGQGELLDTARRLRSDRSFEAAACAPRHACGGQLAAARVESSDWRAYGPDAAQFGLTTQGVTSSTDLRVGVSSFGYSGTISHAVLLRAPDSSSHASARLGATPLVSATRVFPVVELPHPFVQHQLSSSIGTLHYRSLSSSLRQVVFDHVIQGRVILPGAGYLEMARATSSGARAVCLTGVFFLHPLALEDTDLHVDCKGSEVNFQVTSGGSGRFRRPRRRQRFIAPDPSRRAPSSRPSAR